MKINLIIITLFTANIANNMFGMEIYNHLKSKYNQAIMQSSHRYKTSTERHKFHVKKTPLNVQANTTEAHTCNVLNALIKDLKSKKLSLDHVESCKIQTATKHDKMAIKTVLKRKYPTLRNKTFIEYTDELPKDCHVTLEALVVYNYQAPKQAKL